MKICPSCSARLGDDVSVCSSCEYRFHGGDGKVDSGAKKTMMGLPALTDYRPKAQGSDAERSGSPAKSPVGSTLFGLPALNFADLASESSETADDATSMISAKDLKHALQTEMKPGDVLSKVESDQAAANKPVVGAGASQKSEISKMTAFGMRAPTQAEIQAADDDDASDEPFGAEFGGTGDGGDGKQHRLSGARATEVSAALRGWDLGEVSSEVDHHQATQVVSAEMMERSGFGSIGRDAQAISFDAEEYSEMKHTIMGMQIDSEDAFKPAAHQDRFTDATRSVNPSELFGPDALLDADGLPKNLLDKVRNETLARQTTSLNVPSISSTPVSGLVRARSESGQQLRAMMDTPVMYSDALIADESSVVDAEVSRETPASGVFKKLKRRLAAEAAEQSSSVQEADSELSGIGLYKVGGDRVPTASNHDDSFDDLFEDSPEPKVVGGSTLSSMADALASIPSGSSEFIGDLNLSDPVMPDAGKVERAVAEVAAVETPKEAAVVQAAVVQAAVVQAAVGQAVDGVRADEVVAQEKPRVVIQAGAGKDVSAKPAAAAAAAAAAEKGLSKGILIAVLVGLLILGLVAFILLK